MKKLLIQRPTSCAFVNDGKYLAVTTLNSDDICLYDVHAVQRVVTNEFTPKVPQRRLEGHMDKALCIVDDGQRYLASGGKDKAICVWSRDDYTLIRKLLKHKANVTCLCFSPDKKHLASASYDGTVCVWNMANNFLLLDQFSHHQRGVTCLQYSPNGKFLATGSNDTRVYIYDVLNNYVKIHELTDSNGFIKMLSFSNNSEYLAVSNNATTTRDNNAKIYKTRNEFQLMQEIAADGNCLVAKFSNRFLNLTTVSSQCAMSHWILNEDDQEQFVRKQEPKVIAGFNNLCTISLNDTSFAAVSLNGVLFWQLKFKTDSFMKTIYFLLSFGIAPYIVLDIMNFVAAHETKIDINTEQKWFHYQKVKLIGRLQDRIARR